MKSAWLLLALTLVACKDPALNVDGERVESRAVSTRAAGKAVEQPVAPPSTGKKGGGAIQWEDSLDWKTWEEGARLAKASNKPIFLMVYADWCPHCKNLKAVFNDAEIKKLSESMVMVRQNSESDDAGWLASRVGSFGSYVPRIFFLSPEGAVKPEITSANPKYPYFYTPEGVAMLKASMKRAAGG